MSATINLKSVIDDIFSFKKALKNFENPTTTKYINFMEIIISWIEDLVSIRIWEEIKLSANHWIEIKPFLFLKTLDLLNKGELSLQLMLQESVNLINKIIDLGTISAVDFNLLQFNLARIYGKTSDIVIEQCRHNLLVKLTRERAVIKKTGLSDSERNSLLSIPDKELGKLIISQTFQFIPSARTKSEHKLMLNKHKMTLINQRNKLKEFSKRLYKAAQISRAKAKVRVRLQVETIRKKQKQQYERIKADMNRRYGIDVSYSRSDSSNSFSKQFIGTKSENDQTKKGGSIPTYQKNIMEQLDRHVDAIESYIHQKKDEYILVRKIKEQFVHKKFNYEFSVAKNKIFKQKNILYNEVNVLRQYYSDQSKLHFKAPEVLNTTKLDFENSKRFLPSNSIQNVTKIKKTKDSLILDPINNSRGEKKTLSTGPETLTKQPVDMAINSADSENKTITHLKEGDIAIFDSNGHQFILNKSIILTNEAKLVRERNKSRINFDKELFKLDIRFAQYRLKNASKKFKNLTLSKNEEIKVKQLQLIARHRAKFKSRLIRNLLRSFKLMRK